MASERQCSADLLAGVAEQVVGTGARARFVVHGYSMFPCIRDGDTIEVVATTPEAVQPGQILFCRTNADRPVVHRVVDVIRDTAGVHFVLRGDTVVGGNEIVSPASVIGCVVAVERRGRRHELTGFRGRLWSQRAFRLLVGWWLRARRLLGRLAVMATSRVRS